MTTDGKQRVPLDHPDLPRLVREALESLLSLFRPIINHFGLTEQQWRILRVLGGLSGAEQHELARACQIVPPSLTGVLSRMERDGLVERSRVASDQRRVLVTLAPKGRATIASLAPLIDAQYQALTDALGTPLAADLERVLNELVAAVPSRVRRVGLGASDGPPGP
ncbi:MAG TPA: homoprotocatechuate degradation operon regulator HpaR [Acidimicrobiales bacterium]|nr:homoprotocatechuate degradation operon regulator HpaR [Acidimicrobiales bacterium]